MGLILTEKITSPVAWKADDMVKDQSWIRELAPGAIGSIDAAFENVKTQGLEFPRFTRADFPLPALAEELASWADYLENGRGFLLLRGLPIERYSEDEIAAIFERATEAQHVARRQLPPGEGLTLAELQEIGGDVGLSPELVAEAARSLDRQGRSASRRSSAGTRGP